MATTSTKKRQEIGERLRHERERLGYTKQQIAQLLGVPIPAYERFENGDDDPGVYRLPRLAACGFDVMFIITAERHVPVAEENELLSRFRDLSQRGRASIFSTRKAGAEPQAGIPPPLQELNDSRPSRAGFFDSSQ